MQKKFLLREVKVRNRVFYYVLLIFIALNLFFTLLRIESPPFYVYGMFSSPAPKLDTQTIYIAEIDGIAFNEPQLWNHHKRIMFNYTIEYYDRSIQADSTAVDGIGLIKKLSRIFGKNNYYVEKVFTTRQGLRRYPFWLKDYLQSLSGKRIHELRVYRVKLIFNSDCTITTLSKTLVCKG